MTPLPDVNFLSDIFTFLQKRGKTCKIDLILSSCESGFIVDPKPIDDKDEELPSKKETEMSEKRLSENFLTKPNTSPRMETLRKRSFRQSLRESTLWESMPNLNNPMARYKEFGF